MTLTGEQMWFFRHNGFLRLTEKLPTELVERTKEIILRDIREEIEPVRRDKDGTVHRISNILDRDPIFMKIATWLPVMDALGQLIGPNIEIIRNRHNHVMLRTSTAGYVYMHRDCYTWSRNSVSALFFLEETNLENGCTEVIPGTHLLPWFESPLEENEEVQKMGILDQVVRLPMPAGGILLMDSYVMHSQGRNYSGDSRMSITLGYHSVDELAGVDNPKSILLRGKRVYAGNDGGR